jgi:CheY-like chemotaxis protein
MNKPVLILLIDDDADDRELFCEAVAEVDKSINCITATNGEHALKLLSDAGTVIPDFIFLDLNMPRMGGRQCLKQLKKLKHLQQTTMIIYSTSKLPEDEEEARKSGAEYFLTKPDTLDQLKVVIGYVLAGKWSSIRSTSKY